jgi:sugar O-acyltransferase (sialic acid O-acetyltransferase NeuD family)
MDAIKQIFLVGNSSFAQIAFEYFSSHTKYKVIAFVVDKEYIKEDSLLGVPVVSPENAKEFFDVKTTGFHVAIPYIKMNTVRENFIELFKQLGFKPVSYISPSAFVWSNVLLGEHVFIFEGNTVQPFCKIGNNTILWSGNHIGHHSEIGNNVFISSQVVISGHTKIGDNSFVGVNSTISNNISIGKFNWIGMGTILGKDSNDYDIFKQKSTLPHHKNVKEVFLNE